MKTKEIKKVIINILLCANIIILDGCKANTGYVSKKESNLSHHANKKDIKKNEFKDNLEVCDKDKIQQWALKNNGTFTAFNNSFENWGDDTPKSVKGVDLEYAGSVSHKAACETVVAIIDTTIDFDSFSFRDHVWINQNEKIDNIDNDNNGYIDDIYGYNFISRNKQVSGKFGYHGTSIMGILCGKDSETNFKSIIGNYHIKFMCLPVLEDVSETADIENLIEAVKYAENNGADICLLSLGTYTWNKELCEVISKSKMLFVVASGNDGLDLDHEIKVYPASFSEENIIVVAAMRSDGKIDCTSNYGEKTVDIAAPGTNILSTLPDGEYAYFSGSSFAAPYVAGIIAKLYNLMNNEISAVEAKEIILSHAKRIGSLEGKVKTAGCINERNILTNYIQ